MGEKHTAVMSSMNADIFIDTNILVYAHDRSEAKKHEIAKVLISEIWNIRNSAAISIQVLQEFFTTMIRNGGDPGVFRNIAENYMQWQVIENTCALLKKAFDVQGQYHLSFYDSNIIAAAQLSGAKVIWTENLNTGQVYGNVAAVNPFHTGPHRKVLL